MSCRKENLNGSSTLSDSTVIFSASINGVAWQTDSVSAFLVGDHRTHTKIITIAGYTSQRVIEISLRDTSSGSNDSTMTVQQYPLDSWGNASAFGYGNNRIYYGSNVAWQQQGTGVTGTADVTASDGVNKRISGTFSFTARLLVIDSVGITKDSVTVTNGVFKNIPYSYLKHP